MKIYSILKNIIISNNNVNRLGSITAGNSMTVNIPSSHFGLIVLHGVYTSLTAILEVYCNASGSVSLRTMAMPNSATATHFTTSTATNTLTINNTDSVGSIAAVDFIGFDAARIVGGGS